MIDPIHSLAFSVQSSRGVYVVLLGSGVSRTAKIPTGWEVTLDLIRKLAEISGETCAPSPEVWYMDKFGQEPDYSVILASIAKTPAERQQLLRSYWEPSEQEREEGTKQPTAAHRAISSLVERGFIKVIITTNFDRLMETALAEVGVTPTVLSTPDQVAGAVPLIHTRCCVFKVHGDYLDTRILNTAQELSGYPPEFDSLLDRIFDEFGLIVCGWSAEWDEALVRALFRTPSRRFTTYWVAHGEAKESAKRLIDHRGARVIAKTDANSFFVTLQRQVQSLEEFSRPHPLSTKAAVASVKRYLSEPRFRIQLADLVADEVERVMAATSEGKFPVEGAPPNGPSATSRVRSYEAICSTLLAIAPVGAFWAEEPHYHIWQRALERLSSRRSPGGFEWWLGLQRYPGTLFLYALGLGAVEANRLGFLGKLFSTTIHREHQADITSVVLLPPFKLVERTSGGKFLEGMERSYTPFSDWLHRCLRPYLKDLIPNEVRYSLAFDKLEILISLGYAYRSKKIEGFPFWVPPGSYADRRQNKSVIMQEIKDSVTKTGDNSPYVVSNIFGDSVALCAEALAAFEDFAAQIGSLW